jgi:hypothetical protein
MAILLLWIPVTILLFGNKSPHKAAALSLILGVFLLPAAQEVIVLPVIPHMERRTVIPTAIFIASLVRKKPLFRDVRVGKAVGICFLLIGLADILQVFTNFDILRYGPVLVPGTLPQNTLTFMMYDALQIGVMFGLGAAFGREPERLKYFLICWLTTAVLYVPLAATEVRLSPRVNIWVYGYLQHDITQMVRQGGFRPIVFMTHSLEVALTIAASTLIGRLLQGSKVRIVGMSVGAASWLLTVLLVLCKSAAALSYGVLGYLMQKVLSPGLRVLIAIILAVVVLTYPVARLNAWITKENTAPLVSGFGAERTSSLLFRLGQEDELLQKLQQRPWAGWGGFARMHVYDKYGRDLSTTDGSWIIELGSGGTIRFLGVFGILTAPIFAMRRTVARAARTSRADASMFASLCLLSAFMTLDLLPNSFFNYLAFTVAGVLCGISDRMRRDPVNYWETMTSAAAASNV